MSTENTNPDNAAKAAVGIAGDEAWKLFQLPDGRYAGGRRGARMAGFIAAYGRPDADKLAEIEVIPVEDECQAEWDAAMTENSR